MNKIKQKLLAYKVVISILAVFAVAGVASAYALTQSVDVAGDYNYYESEGQAVPIEPDANLGAFSGGDLHTDVSIFGNLTTGRGEYTATSSVGSAGTLNYKDLDTYLISFTANLSAYTFTLPATSTMFQLLPEIGATREWLIHNATTTGSITLTTAAGAGMDLVGVTANDDVIDPGEFTRLTCTRIPYLAADNENIMCIVDELTNAD